MSAEDLNVQVSSNPATEVMVKAKRTNRIVAMMTALVFLLLGAGDLFGLRACPHHESSDGHGGAHASAPERSLHHEHREEAPSSVPDANHEPCTCAGFCPTAPTVGLPADTDVPVAFTVAAAELPVVGDTGSEFPRFIPFFLPYSQAPPLS
jgi:hypothetical protein